MYIEMEQNKYIEKFFKHNKKYECSLKKEILDNITSFLNEKAYKVKIINKLKYKGSTIYEYKISLDKDFVCRVAYIRDNEKICVFYISTNIIKANFVKELSIIKGISKKG